MAAGLGGEITAEGFLPIWLLDDILCDLCPLPQYRSLVYMVYGLLAVWTSMGWTYVTLILSHCILLYSISLVKIRWLCFVTGLCTLATFKCEPFVSWQVIAWRNATHVALTVWVCNSFLCIYIGRFCGGRL